MKATLEVLPIGIAGARKLSAAETPVARAIRAAKAAADKPSLICRKTVVAKGPPDKAGMHAALGEVAATRRAIGWPYPSTPTSGWR